MPELPEVEFARACLSRWLQGRRIRRARALEPRILRGADAAALGRLSDRRVERIERRGKWLLWHLEGGLGLLAHLGMTGRFVLRAFGAADEPWSRACFVRDDDAVVHLRDPRIFGRIVPGTLDELQALAVWRTLGPDAWDERPSARLLAERMKGRTRAVKDVLMDQTVVAGLGNIQATDALYLARLHPARAADSLAPDELRRLASGIRQTLERSLAMNAGDELEYLADGAHVENPFLVYGRAGSPCPRCGTLLARMEIGGRTSAFCPRCQPPR